MRSDGAIEHHPTKPHLAAVLSLASVTLLFVAFSIQSIWGADIWWQLRTGECVLRDRGVPVRDVFSYTVPTHEWIELRWIYCVLAYLGWQAGGPALLILAKTAVLAAAMGLLIWPSRHVAVTRRGVTVIALAIVASSPRFVVRPEILSYLFIAIFLLVLDAPARGRTRSFVWLLPPLQVIWTNSHTLFVFGPILAWVFALSRSIPTSDDVRFSSRARWSLLAAAALVTLACWLNPYGTRGALFPLTLFREIQGSHVLAQHIGEFRSPLGASPAQWSIDVWAGAALAALGAASFALRWRSVDVARLVVFVSFAYLGATAHRNLALFALVALWAILRNFAERGAGTRIAAPPGRFSAPAHLVLSAGLLALSWYVASDRLYAAMGSDRRTGLGVVEANRPAGAVEFVMRCGAQARIYHSMGDGGYLIWRAHDRFTVFVDGRLEVYGEEFLATYFASAGTDWATQVNRWDIKTALVQRDGFGWLIAALKASPDWVLVYLDARNLIYVRNVPEHAQLIAEHRIDPKRPWTPREPEPDEAVSGWRRAIGSVASPWYSLGMAQSFLAVDAADNATPYLERALTIDPGNAEALPLLAAIYRLRGRDSDADILLSQFGLARDARARTVQVLAELLLSEGRFAVAVEPLDRAIHESPNDATLRTRLADVRMAMKDYPRAADAFADAVRLAPNDFALWIRHGVACEQAARQQDAIRAYQSALRLRPDQYRIHNQLGIVYAQCGDIAAARKCFEAALRLNPGYSPARANLERARGAK